MKNAAREKILRLERLAEALGPDVVARGALQYFFARPIMPQRQMNFLEYVKAWKGLTASVKKGRTEELLSLYVHIPFCPHKCRYCIYYSLAGAEPETVEAYLDRLHTEIDILKPVFKGLTFSTWYIGGGTPTLLSIRQLDSLLRHIETAFSRREGGQYAFECSPLTITPEKAALFARYGFNRVSFGVQTVRQDVLKTAGRGYQTGTMVAKAFKILKKEKFWINADLLYGLAGDSVKSAGGSLKQVFEFEPDQVTLYEVSPSTPVPQSRSRRVTLPVMKKRLKSMINAAGYQVGEYPTCLNMMRKSAKARFWYQYSDMDADPYSLLTLGPLSRFYLYGMLRGSFAKYDPGDRLDLRAQVISAQDVTLLDEQRRFAIHALEERGRLGMAKFRKQFGNVGRGEVLQTLNHLVGCGRLRLSDGVYLHTSTDLNYRFLTSLHFIDDRMLEAAENDVRGAGGVQDGSPKAGVQFLGRLIISSGSTKLEVVVENYAAGSPCAHSCGAFCFMLPLPPGKTGLKLGSVESSMLSMFIEHFDRIVQTRRPGSLDSLMAALLRRKAGPLILNPVKRF